MSDSLSPQEKKWLEQYCDETISAADLAEFEQRLLESEELRRVVRRYLALDSHLFEVAASDELLPHNEAVRQAESLQSQSVDGLSMRYWGTLLTAAVFLVGVGIGAWLLPQGAEGPASPPANSATGTYIARLDYVSEDTVFDVNGEAPQSGSALGKGWLQLTSGTVKIAFGSGALVELVGPAVFGVDTPMRGYLEHGRVKVTVPESARDFVVATEGMEVVDLGTEFELEVNSESGESNVVVREGLVDLHLGSRGTPRRIKPLTAGGSAKVDATGSIVDLSESASPRQKNLKRQPLAHWRLDENAGSGIADAAGKLDGQLGGAETPRFVAGQVGSALSLRRGEFVDISRHIERLRALDSFTIATWIQRPQDSVAIVFSLSDGTERNRVQFHLNRRHVVYGWQNGSHYDAISGQVAGWDPKRWYHVAVVHEDGMLRLYSDGKRIASSSVGGKIGTRILVPNKVEKPTTALLGRLPDCAIGERTVPQSYRGNLDDFQLYDMALNDTVIQFLYEHPGATAEEIAEHTVGGEASVMSDD